MKQQYQIPETEVVLVEQTSIICSSGEKVSSVRATDFGMMWDDEDD